MVMAEVRIPSLLQRIFSVWYRHFRVYSSSFISNAIPPMFEPLLFLAGIGLGLAKYLVPMEGLPFLTYMGSGLLMTSAMMTSAFECTYGTFIRLEYDKTYDGMISSPVSYKNLVIGEIIWAGTKGAFFTFCVLLILFIFDVIHFSFGNLMPLLSIGVGFFTGVIFGGLSMCITSITGNINHFNFYFTGLLSPMFYFCGVFFPVSDLPEIVRPLAEAVPLTHCIRVARAFAAGSYPPDLWISAVYIVVSSVVFSWLAVVLMKRRLID
ncbi:MAG: ABC transporter permease [Brevinematales bacterium]|nr:ABC transporter permease [Brevinematales bacterium]